MEKTINKIILVEVIDVLNFIDLAPKGDYILYNLDTHELGHMKSIQLGSAHRYYTKQYKHTFAYHIHKIMFEIDNPKYPIFGFDKNFEHGGTDGVIMFERQVEFTGGVTNNGKKLVKSEWKILKEEFDVEEHLKYIKDDFESFIVRYKLTM